MRYIEIYMRCETGNTVYVLLKLAAVRGVDSGTGSPLPLGDAGFSSELCRVDLHV